MAKAFGLGGVFFKSADPKKLCEWYAQHLGFTVDNWGGVQFQPAAMPPGGCTVWTPFKQSTDHFSPSTKDFMLNFVVDDVAGVLDQVRAGGATVIGEIQDYDYGRFGHFMDPEGNKVELWQPKA